MCGIAKRRSLDRQRPTSTVSHWCDLPTPSSTGSLRNLLGPQGEGHAVVVLGRDPEGSWIIADPAFGKTSWTDQVFRDRFTGDAIYLDSK